MSKKKLTYPLLFIVAIIWGKIIYDLAGFSSVDEVPVTAMVETEVKPSIQSVDTFSLLLDYPDPFLVKNWNSRRAKSNSQIIAESNLSVRKKESNERASRPWPKLEYKGLLKNNDNNKKLGIVEISQKSYIMAESEQQGGLELVWLLGDSAMFRLGDESQVFVKR